MINLTSLCLHCQVADVGCRSLAPDAGEQGVYASDDSVSDRFPRDPTSMSISDSEREPFSDSETLMLPGGVDPDEHQWWYPENWALESDVYFGFGPGNCRWAWDPN